MNSDMVGHIEYVTRAHRDYAINYATRKWDGKTPYSIHPIWCAMTILTETSLSDYIRENGSLALLYHDIVEDTSAPLPKLPKQVVEWINDMSFEGASQAGGSEIKMKGIWNRTQEVRLLELYDSTSNLLDGTWMPADKRSMYIDFTRKLADDVARNYGELNIVRMARAFIL